MPPPDAQPERPSVADLLGAVKMTLDRTLDQHQCLPRIIQRQNTVIDALEGVLKTLHARLLQVEHQLHRE